MDLKGHGDLNAVSNLDKGDAAVHPKFLTVKRHGALNLAIHCPLASKRKVQRLGLKYSTDSKSPLDIEGSGTGLHNLGGVEGYVRIIPWR
jgi:hypothetical protein